MLFPTTKKKKKKTPLLPVPAIGLRVSVDVKHHVYFTKGGGGEGERS